MYEEMLFLVPNNNNAYFGYLTSKKKIYILQNGHPYISYVCLREITSLLPLYVRSVSLQIKYSVES